MKRASETSARRPRGTNAAGAADLRVAAIDVGSNSIHMVVAQVDPDGAVTTLWRLKEMVGLGRISFPSRKLAPEAVERAVATLGRFQQEVQRRQVEQTIVVATSAVREAQNGGDFIERVRQELGLPIRVISAAEEARLIYLGVRHATGFSQGVSKAFPELARRKGRAAGTEAADDRVLIVDVGGGSVEFIVADSAKALMLESRKLGASRMTAQFVHSDPISKDDLRAMLAHYDAELAPLCQQIDTLRPRFAVGTSGTLETLSALCAAGAKSARKPENPGLTGWIGAKPLAKLTDKLLASKSADRSHMAGLDDKRQDQILAGAVLVNELFRRLSIDQMAMCGAAMREGMVVDYITRHLPDLAVRRDVPDPRRRSVLDLARRCDWRREHSEHVAKLTLELFDALRPQHKLGRTARELIEYGALLHDIGWHVGSSGHHKHSMYLILHGGLKGFEPEEVKIIANVARYHRKSPPKPEHADFEALSAKAKQIVLVGGALLRMADGLDRSHCRVIRSVKAKAGPVRVRVQLQGKGDLELEVWAARRKTDLFTKVFEREAVFETGKK